MSPWARRRKLIIFLAIVAIFLIAVALYGYVFVYKTPTCLDGKQNQDETGIDCGGVCARLCPAEALEPTILWQRAFKVADGVYNAIAYVENPNLTYRAQKVAYVFRLYDKDSVLVAERKGYADILAKGEIPIFEANLYTGAKTAGRLTFEFTAMPVWKKDTSVVPEVRINTIVLEQEKTSPKLSAIISNETLSAVKGIPVIAIIYDTDGNAMAASRTFVDRLDPKGTDTVIFTWPEPFPRPISEKKIIPVITTGEVF